MRTIIIINKYNTSRLEDIIQYKKVFFIIFFVQNVLELTKVFFEIQGLLLEV